MLSSPIETALVACEPLQPPVRAALERTEDCSTRVFQAPQSLHCPAHWLWVAPQAVH